MRVMATRHTGSRRRPVARLIGLSIIVMLGVGLLADPAGAAARPRPRPPLPDLAISEVKHSRYAFVGESASAITFCDRTKNIGRAATPRRIHNTMALRGPDGVLHVVAQRDAPKLPKPNKPRRGPRRVFSHRGCANGEGVLNLPPGAYGVVVCADRRLTEVTKANNCVEGAKSFFVAKRTWSGTASGTGAFIIELQPEAESWLATSLVYTFDPAAYRNGFFTYRLTAGNVSWKTAASANGCVKSGAAVDGSPTGMLTINYLDDTYLAFGVKNPGFTYTITNSCDPTGPANGPNHPVFLDSGLGAPPRPLPFGTVQIAGTRTELNEFVVTWALQ